MYPPTFRFLSSVYPLHKAEGNIPSSLRKGRKILLEQVGNLKYYFLTSLMILRVFEGTFPVILNHT